jgi:hypothetical protein
MVPAPRGPFPAILTAVPERAKSMERGIFLKLLTLELLLRLHEAEERLATALESTLGTVRRLYPELLGVDPNGSTWIGFEGELPRALLGPRSSRRDDSERESLRLRGVELYRDPASDAFVRRMRLADARIGSGEQALGFEAEGAGEEE